MKKLIYTSFLTLFLSPLSAADIMLPETKENKHNFYELVKESTEQDIKNYSLKNLLPGV